jgi:hypothetical protein
MHPRAQLARFIAAFTPEIAAQTRAILAKMRARLPGAVELVYDNYNALAIGFAPSERTSETVFSIAVFPRWVSLFFFRGRALADPHGMLRGTGNQVRHIVLDGPKRLDDPAVVDLMAQALALAAPPIDPDRPRRLVIKSVSPTQRPRRPVTSAGATRRRASPARAPRTRPR